jgi:hypothetical protein
VTLLISSIIRGVAAPLVKVYRATTGRRSSVKFVGIFLLLNGLTLVLAGCCATPAPVERYTGPTESMAAVVAQVNENNSHLDHFHAVLRYSAAIVDPERHETQRVSGDGGLLYSRPQSLLLRGKKDLVGPVFELGSNDSVFWFKVLVGDSAEWWGHYRNLGKPCCKPIPIRPDLVLEVLGVSMFDKNLLAEPVPVMRFDNDTDAYVFVWSKMGHDHWYPWKEIAYDRRTKLARVVKLYDEDGRVLLRAELSEYAPASVANLPEAQWPMLARHYELVFLENGSHMEFDFTGVKFTPAPRSESFVRPVLKDTERDPIQIDRDCDE